MSTVPLFIIAPREDWDAIWQEYSQGVDPADLWVPMDITQTLTMEQGRELQRFAILQPRGKEKMALIPGLDTVRTDLANSLLKLLEEPPDYLRIIMLGESRKVLPTILSRVQVIESDAAGELSDQWSEALTGFPVHSPSQREKIRAILYLASLRHNQIKAENVVGPFKD